MINYIEKGTGLHVAIAKAGYVFRQENGFWISDNNIAVQAIIDSYDPLPDYKLAKITTIKNVGLTKINTLFPAISSLDQVAFFAEFWLSIAPAARSATVNFKMIIDIYNAAKTGITNVNAAASNAAVDAVTISWPV